MIKTGYIYKITNDVNGKIYIGKTEHENPEDRWKEHLNEYKKNRSEKRPLYEAINKYGEKHFHFEVIEKTNIPEDREKYWINELRTYIGFEDCNGYNDTYGGDGKKYYNPNEIIETYLMLNSVKDTASKLKCSEDTVRKYCKQAEINTNSIHELFKIEIKTMTVTKYSNLDEASYDNKNFVKNKIRKASQNMYVYKDCIWLRKKDYCEENIQKIVDRYIFEHDEKNNSNNKYSKIIDKSDEKIEKAQKQKQIIRRKRKYDYDAIYRDYLKTNDIYKTFENFNIPKDYFKAIQILRRDYNILLKDKMVLCQYSKDGKLLNTYETIKDANIALGKPPYSRNISSCLNGKTKYAYGYIWKYEKFN